MPSSIASSASDRSEPAGNAPDASSRLLKAWSIGALVALLLLAGLDVHWRGQGFAPEITDSKQLWASQRDRVYTEDGLPVVFIGASRTAYGIDLNSWSERFPATRPIMLAVNGHYPLALLRDLAADEAFHGLVLCDINPEGLLPKYRDMQQPWVDYYHQQWTPSWKLHRWLLNGWQQFSVLGNPELGWKASLQRWIAAVPAPLPVPKIDANRNGYARFERIPDLVAYGRWFEDDAVKKMQQPLIAPDAFVHELSDVLDWVHAIQARGGQVVFFQPPVAGKIRQLEYAYYPRSRYWDAFAALPGIHSIQTLDLPEVQSLKLPDLSHVSRQDRAVLTRALAAQVEEMGLIDAQGRLLAETGLTGH